MNSDDVLPPIEVAEEEAVEQENREAAEVERFYWPHIRSESDGEVPF